MHRVMTGVLTHRACKPSKDAVGCKGPGQRAFPVGCVQP